MGSDHSQRQTNLEAGHFDVVRHGDENYRSQLQESFEPADRVNLHMINRVTCKRHRECVLSILRRGNHRAFDLY